MTRQLDVGSRVQPIEERIRAGGDKIDHMLAHSIYGSLLEKQPHEGVRVIRDLAYGDDPLQTLDLYRPVNSLTSKKTTIIFFHGGGFIKGDKNERENCGYFFARRDITVLIPNYRLAPMHRWPSGAQDVAYSYFWAQKHATQYNFNPDRIFLAGESAGAAHVAAAVFLRRFQPMAALPPAGVILISGVYNPHLEYKARKQFGIDAPDVRNEAYYGSKFAEYLQMSTVELIDVAPFAVLITYAELDPLQMQVQSCELFTRLVHHGFTPALKIIRGHNHLTQVFSVNTGDEALTSAILAFLQPET